MSSIPAGCALEDAAVWRLGELPQADGLPRAWPGGEGRATGAWHGACQQIRCSLRADEGNWHQPLQEMVTTTRHPVPVSARAHDPPLISGLRTRAGGNVWWVPPAHAAARAAPAPCPTRVFAATMVLGSLFTPCGCPNLLS